MATELSFGQAIEKERNRLRNIEETIQEKISKLESELEAVFAELRAVDAYEATKNGKVVRASNGRRGKTRAARGSVGQTVLAAIKKGLNDRKKLISTTGLSGQQVSNALTALKKAGAIGSAKRGTYKALKA
jgi:predicted Rossmann fold nucleotide-binding protein DprA/Smf involved in DNA uptake